MPTQGRGEFVVELLGPDGLVARRAVTPNRLMADWAPIACLCFGDGDPRYRLRSFYLEFANLVDPDDAIDVPDDSGIDPLDGRSYYAALSASSDRDYLRVSISTLPYKYLEAGYEDSGLPFNALRFQASTQGSEGVNGKPFSAVNNSKIYGVALVAAPNWDDPSQDLVYARGFYAAETQLLKPSSGQVSIGYKRIFTY